MHVSDTELTDADAVILCSHAQLTSIDASHNKLSDITLAALASHHHMRVIDLAHNKYALHTEHVALLLCIPTLQALNMRGVSLSGDITPYTHERVRASSRVTTVIWPDLLHADMVATLLCIATLISLHATITIRRCQTHAAAYDAAREAQATAGTSADIPMCACQQHVLHALAQHLPSCAARLHSLGLSIWTGCACVDYDAALLRVITSTQSHRITSLALCCDVAFTQALCIPRTLAAACTHSMVHTLDISRVQLDTHDWHMLLSMSHMSTYSCSVARHVSL